MNAKNDDDGMMDWFRDLIDAEAKEKAREVEDLEANQAAMAANEDALKKAAEEKASAERDAEAVKGLSDPDQPQDPEALERVRDLVREKIHAKTRMWIQRFVDYEGEEHQQYEITTSKGTVRFSNISALGTWGEAKLIFAQTEDRFIDRLSPKVWHETSNLIMMLKEAVDLGPGVRSVETLADAIDSYLSRRRPKRLDTHRRLKERVDSSHVVVAEDRAGLLRKWIQLADFMKWTSREEPGQRMERARVLADLARMEREAGRPGKKPIQWRIHRGANKFHRDSTSIFYGLDPRRFPIQEDCLEPEDPEDLLETNPYAHGPKSTEELGEMLPEDAMPEDMGEDQEEEA